MRLHVGEMALSLAGVSEADGRRLVRLIAAHLAAAAPDGAPPVTDHLRVRLAARAGEDLDAMAARIATELVRALARSA